MKLRFAQRQLIIVGAMLSLALVGTLVVLYGPSPRSGRGPDLGTAPVIDPGAAQRHAIPARPADATFVSQGQSSRVAEIMVQLDSGQDARTELEFKVGMNGGLASAPTRRVALLDELGHQDPKVAAAYAERILRDFNSPDEWAVSLRNYARANSTPEGRAFLEGKTRAMLTHELWQKNPSAGFLEAFDVAVYLGGTKLTPVLTDLLRLKDNVPVSHAAYLALDRLVISEPLPVLEYLLRHPEAMQGREVTRANYFARANISDPAQKELLEKYLLDTERPAIELRTFAGLFPNFNFMVSVNLLTHCATPDEVAISRQDREALRMVDVWLADPRFASVESHLKTIRSRLNQFVKQARSEQ